MSQRHAKPACLRFATRCCVLATCCLLAAGTATSSLWADYRENFDSPEPTLHLADADCAAEVLAQERVFQHAHGGVGCERLLLRSGRGTRIYLDQTIVPAQVIDELKIHAWVKGDRTGFQLLARVVFPRTRDRRTGEPLTTLVWGNSYRDVGSWQMLTIAHLPKLVERQVRVLNSERGETIDARQAYIDKIVVNAYAGAGLTQFWIDDLEIEGHATPPSWSEDRRLVDSPPAPRVPSAKGTTRSTDVRATSLPAATTSDPAAPRLQGSVLLAQGKPFFPRAVIDRGESLSWLRSLGFNTVFLADGGSTEQFATAVKHELWLVVPQGQETSRTGKPGGTSGEARGAAADDRILAVLVPPGASRQAHDRRLRVVGIPAATTNSRMNEASGDLFMAREPRVNPSPESSETAGADGAGSSTIAPGRPTWILLDTEQLVHDALLDAPTDGEIRRDRLRSALRVAALRSVATGARGLCFSNALPASLSDADVPRWTAVVEVVLRELDAISPWVAGGTAPEPLTAPAPGWQAFALEANRSRLIVLTADRLRDTELGATSGARAGHARRTTTWGETALQRRSATVPLHPPLDVVDPGAPTSADAYLLGEATLRPLPRQRVAGGVLWKLETADSAALAVVTQDPLVVNYLARRGTPAVSAAHAANVARRR